jgi:hypothetical protein
MNKMNKTEIIDLLELISAVDGRKTNEMTIQAWLMPLQDVSFADAISALNFCRKDVSIGWLEPKHIYAKSREIVSRRITEQESIDRANESNIGVPCPKCKHNMSIINCVDCCRMLSDSTNPNRTFFELTGVRV